MLSLFKNGAHIFKKKQEDILSAAFLITVSIALSRILGFVRLRLLATYFGDDLHLLDAYFAATIIPDSIFEVFIFGSIALAFIPVFSKHLSKDKLNYAWRLASALMTLGFIFFLIVGVLIFVFSTQIAALIAPGLVAQAPQTQHIISRLLQIIIFSQVFFVVSIFLTGILHSFQRFLVPALASVFYNIGIIISIIFLAPLFGIYAAAIGMIFGALLHLIIQLPLISSLGFKYRPQLDFKNKDVREILKLMWPRSAAIGLTRLMEMINIALASSAAIGSIVALNFAQVLQVAPTAFFASSISQAAFVFFAIEYNRGKTGQFKKIFTESLHQILFLILPAAAILAILRVPVVRLIFGARDLPWETTVLTARTLLAFSVGITAQGVNLLLIRGFHAVHDSFTPVRVILVSTTLGILLSLIFILVFHLPIIWLALSYSLVNITTALTLLYLLDKKVGGFDRKQLFLPIVKIGTISALMAIFLYIPMKLLDQLVFDTTRTIGLIFLTAIATLVGLTVYVGLSWLFKVDQLAIFIHFGKRVLSWPSKLKAPPPPPIEAQSQTP